MKKYLVSGLVTGIILSLTGCMNSIKEGNLFSAYPSQETLTQSVQDALMRSGDPVIAQVHVAAQQQVVSLSGYVKKIRQSDTAEQIARQVPGVKVVENNLIVRQ